MAQVTPLQSQKGRKRLLFVQTRMEAHGGGNIVTCWVLQALQDEYDVTVLTWRLFDFAALNRLYGTSLDSARITVRTVHPLLRRFVELDPDVESIQPNMLVQRIAKRWRRRFNLLLSAEMESDFGERGLQYIHAPWLENATSRAKPLRDLPWKKKLRALIRGEIRPWMLLGDYSFDRMRNNATLTNSDWTAEWIRRVYDMEAITLYPPAPGAFVDVPWDQRENGVLCIGRLHPLKRADWIIEQLAPLRSVMPDLKIHIIGNQSNNPLEKSFVHERLMPLIKANADWVILHENVSRLELAALASRQRYGIHAMVDEHFGIAVAEMVRAGCIPFVHNSGGQVEIVDKEKRLLFNDDNLLVQMKQVMFDPAEQNKLRPALAKRASLFMPEHFMNEVREIVGNAIRR
jgi:glycosyltransferase involved in cell wall biosynthesis